MKDFREFQFGWMVFAFTPPIQVLLTIMFLFRLGDRPMGTIIFIVISVTFALIYIFFYGMTTTVTAEKIIVSFGLGLRTVKKSLKEISSVEVVENPWYYGWGIRLIPKGMLYNISGSRGIELKFIDSNRVVRIGSKDPRRLREEIVKRLSSI